jgi:hypothetical protein
MFYITITAVLEYPRAVVHALPRNDTQPAFDSLALAQAECARLGFTRNIRGPQPYRLRMDEDVVEMFEP